MVEGTSPAQSQMPRGVTVQPWPCTGRWPSPRASPAHPCSARSASVSDPNQPGPARWWNRTQPRGVRARARLSRGHGGSRARSPGNEGGSGVTAPYCNCFNQQQNEGCARSRAGSRRRKDTVATSREPRSQPSPAALTQQKAWQIWGQPGRHHHCSSGGLGEATEEESRARRKSTALPGAYQAAHRGGTQQPQTR